MEGDEQSGKGESLNQRFNRLDVARFFDNYDCLSRYNFEVTKIYNADKTGPKISQNYCSKSCQALLYHRMNEQMETTIS